MRLVIAVHHPILDGLGEVGRADVLKAKKLLFRYAG
jgi:hypothetical protein